MYALGGPLDGVTVQPGTNLLMAGLRMSGKTDLGFEVLSPGAAEGKGAIVVTNTDRAEHIRDKRADLFEHGAPVSIVDCVTRYQGQGTDSEDDLVRYPSRRRI